MIKKKQTALFSLKIIYFYLILIIAIITLGLAGFCFYYYKNSLGQFTKNYTQTTKRRLLTTNTG